MGALIPAMSISIFLLIAGMMILLTKRDSIRLLAGIMLIYNAACLNFIIFSGFLDGRGHGQLVALFIVGIIVSEFVSVLAILLYLNHHLGNTFLNKADTPLE